VRQLRALLSRLSGMFGGTRTDAEIAEELETHLEFLADERRRAGFNDPEARRAAVAKFGSFPSAVEAYRDRRGLPGLETLWRDVRYGFRVLAKAPAFTVAAVVSLGLGIGANAAIFQLLNTVAFQDLPVERPNELTQIRLVGEGRLGRHTGRNRQVSAPVWERIRDHQQVFAGVFAFGDTRFNLAPRGQIRYVEGLWVSGSFFPVLGIEPILGRLFTPADDRPGCGYFGAVISHALWQREFGGRADVVGQMLHVGTERVPVIGVTPPSFFGVEVGRRFDVALPICASGFRLPNHFWLAMMGRLRPGDSVAQANEHLAALGPSVLRDTLPPSYRPDAVPKYLAMRFEVTDGSVGVSPLRATYVQPLWLLMAIAGAVLLIAATNLANLMLARATAHEHEFAIRRAIGGSGVHIIRQVMIESWLLAVAGALLGVMLARWSTAILVASIGTAVDPIYLDLGLNWRLMGVTTIIACASCVLFGVAPAFRAAHVSPTLPLAGRGTAGVGPRGGRRILVAFQVGVSLVLVFGAGLFARSFQNLASVETGFRQDDVLVSHVFFSEAELPQERRARFYHNLLERFSAIPGVSAVASTSTPPLSGSFWDTDIKIDGRVVGTTNVNQVSAGYFQVMAMPFLAGRPIDARDTPSAPRVAVVSEAFARKFLAAGPVVDRMVALPGAAGQPDTVFQVVGLVRDSKSHDLKEEFQPILFTAAAQDPNPGLIRRFVMHSTRSTADLMSAVTRTVTEASPNASLRFNILREQIRESLLRDRLVAILSGSFGLLALVLALVGVYGVTSYGVSHRRSEIGVRIALGARRSQIVGMVLVETIHVLTLGLIAGAMTAMVVLRSARTLLFGLEPSDPATLAAAVIVMVLTGAAASAVPAMRAARVSPVTALRH